MFTRTRKLTIKKGDLARVNHDLVHVGNIRAGLALVTVLETMKVEMVRVDHIRPI